MFENIIGFLRGNTSLDVDASGEPTSRDLQVAATFLLVDIAHSDGEFSEAELESIVGALCSEFELDPEESAGLVEISNLLRREPGKTEIFTQVLRDNFKESQRMKLLTLVWKVISVDEDVKEAEAQRAARLRKLLGLSLEQAFQAQDQASD